MTVMVCLMLEQDTKSYLQIITGIYQSEKAFHGIILQPLLVLTLKMAATTPGMPSGWNSDPTAHSFHRYKSGLKFKNTFSLIWQLLFSSACNS